MTTRLLIWVTSFCNLKCPHCSQAYTMEMYPNYDMSIYEITHIVESCMERKIHFDVIELTGGEPSLWDHLEYGVNAFRKICDEVTLVTNGNDPERIKALGLNSWLVSSSQATKEQLRQYEGCPVIYNSHKHKPLPEKAFEDSLPADCCVRISPEGKEQNNILYLKGLVWYCCNAYALTKNLWFIDRSIFIDFNEDFLSFYKDKKFDRHICKYCLCNHKIWNKI